jgi:hypothetical protein
MEFNTVGINSSYQTAQLFLGISTNETGRGSVVDDCECECSGERIRCDSTFRLSHGKCERKNWHWSCESVFHVGILTHTFCLSFTQLNCSTGSSSDTANQYASLSHTAAAAASDSSTKIRRPIPLPVPTPSTALVARVSAPNSSSAHNVYPAVVAAVEATAAATTGAATNTAFAAAASSSTSSHVAHSALNSP